MPAPAQCDRRLRWQVTSASAQGSSHVKSGQPCQDSVRYRTYRALGTPRDTLVAAVADGAGSAPYGGSGALEAANTSIHTATERLRENPNGTGADILERILVESMCAAQKRLDETAHRQGHRIDDYATTLLLAIYAGGTLAAAQIGDGAIIAGSSDGDYHFITSPARGEYANETNFITGRNALTVCQFHVRTDLNVEYIAMFTDGIQNLALDYRRGIPHTPFFRSTFDWLVQQPDEVQAYTGLRRFLQSSRVREHTNDDVTLLLARRL